MSSVIKVDTIQSAAGSTILGQTNATTITLGTSGQTIVPASNVTLSGIAITNGITEADSWRLNTSFSLGNTSFNDLTSNLERDDTTGFNYIGTGMTQSSGVFTFPSTGIYLIFQTWTTYDNADFAWFEGFIRTTVDNSSYSTRSQISTHVAGQTSGSPEMTATGMCMFDVTNTSLCKLKFGYQSSDAATNVYGGNTANVTSFQFIRLGDT